MNGLAESLTRSLRSFRKKAEIIGRSENNAVRPEVMRDLQRELVLTVKELDRDNKSAGTGSGDDEMMAMLETYSSKLLSMVNDRLEGKFPRATATTTTTTTTTTATATANGVDNNGLDQRKADGVETTGEG